MKLVKKVLQYDLKRKLYKRNGIVLNRYIEKCGFTKTKIYLKCCNNKGKTAYKYIWKFKQ